MNINNGSGIYPYYYHGDGVVVFLIILLCIIMVVAVGGNVLVVATIARHRNMRTQTNAFIVSLAVADILVAIVDMPLSAATLARGTWVYGRIMCQMHAFTMALFLITSIHTLMYIAIHKYLSITNPFERREGTTRVLRMGIMVAAPWVWAFLCASFPVLGWTEVIYKLGASQCGPSLPDEPKDYAHSFLITVSNYVLPLSVMAFCYVRIFGEIRRHLARLQKSTNVNKKRSVEQQRRISMTLLLVMICFVVCWTPYIVYSISAGALRNKSRLPRIFNPIAYWCGYLNSACNPLIYAFRSPSFRHGYRDVLCIGTEDGVRSSSFRSRSLPGGSSDPNSSSAWNQSLRRKSKNAKDPSDSPGVNSNWNFSLKKFAQNLPFNTKEDSASESRPEVNSKDDPDSKFKEIVL